VTNDVSTLPAMLCVRDLQQLLGVSDQTIRAYERSGALPPPLSMSKRRKFWDRDTVLRHLEERAAQQRAQ